MVVSRIEKNPHSFWNVPVGVAVGVAVGVVVGVAAIWEPLCKIVSCPYMYVHPRTAWIQDRTPPGEAPGINLTESQETFLGQMYFHLDRGDGCYAKMYFLDR